jgi:hypothetical protein
MEHVSFSAWQSKLMIHFYGLLFVRTESGSLYSKAQSGSSCDTDTCNKQYVPSITLIRWGPYKGLTASPIFP